MHPLQPDTSYHIFNHANGFENIFRHEANYYFFLEKYRKYIGPIAETYAWCLMPNHFHVVVRIRRRQVLEEIIFSKVRGSYRERNNNRKQHHEQKRENFGKATTDIDIGKYLSKQFANLFSCYTQSFNKVYGRMGSLFIKNFKREPIFDKTHFLNSVAYVHRNPIHHQFCKQFDEWPYSSYLDVINGNNDGVEASKLLKITGGLEGLAEIHRRSLERIDTSNYPDIPFIL